MNKCLVNTSKNRIKNELPGYFAGQLIYLLKIRGYRYLETVILRVSLKDPAFNV